MEVTSGGYGYIGAVIVPEEVTYMNRTRKVTSIGVYAFYGLSDLSSVTIPNSVTTIGGNAFQDCSGLNSVTIGNSVTTIGYRAFSGCGGITSVTIPSHVTKIEGYAFEGCVNLSSVHIMDIESWCNIDFIGNDSNPLSYAHHLLLNGTEIKDLVIPNSVKAIGKHTFESCSSLTSVTIGNNVTSIGNYSFNNCSNLTSVTIGNSVSSIGECAFRYCQMLTSITFGSSVTSIGISAFESCRLLTVTIPNTVTSIGSSAFGGCNLLEVISKVENPFTISTSTFSANTYYNATLYVPTGTIDKYKATEGWKKFSYIEEENGGNTPEPQKCEKPTISYSNGKLTFNCSTEGATCQSTITDTDITSYSSNEIQLSVTYNISVYATKAGYENSETATATLCWIDVDPKTEGIENGVAQVRANPVLIQANNGHITVTGADSGTNISAYSVSGQMVAAKLSNGAETTLFTDRKRGEVVIVKIGEKSVKIVMQ